LNPELGLFRDLLKLLFRFSKGGPGRYGDPAAKEIFRVIGATYPPFGRVEEVQDFIPSQEKPITDFKDTGRFLYLKPGEGPPLFIPVVSLFTNFTRSIPEVRLRVGIFLLEGTEIRSIGLRFESPEGEGPHNYYHAQFIKDFNAPVPVEKRLNWLPVTHPPIALDARGPVTLLLSLVVSLYGLEDAGKLAVANPRLGGYLKAMRCTEFTPSYWLVQSGGVGHKYKTWSASDRFRTAMRVRHGRHAQLSSSDRQTFETEDGRSRNAD
jgi:hypothetical protein